MAAKPDKVAWDSSVCIDLLQKTAGRFDAIKVIYGEAVDGRLLLIVSTMAIAEMVKIGGIEPEEQKKQIRAFFDSSFVFPHAADRSVAECARGIRRLHSVGSADSIHLATAIVTESPIFLTYDGDGKKTKRAMLPLDNQLDMPDGKTKLRIMTPEQYNQMRVAAAHPLLQGSPAPTEQPESGN